MSLSDILDKEQYDDYLRRLDARALLEHYGAENITEQVNKRTGETELVHSCLLDRVEPHHTNGDQNPSASCNVDNKKYICYSLGWGGDLFHLVNKLEGRESFADTLDLIGKFLTGATLDTLSFREAWHKSQASNRVNWFNIDLPSYNEGIIAHWINSPHVYWDYRGISADTQAKLKLGYDDREKRIVFPHYVDGVLVGWQRRVIPGETTPDYPKYKNSPGFPKSETLYNLDEAKNHSRVCVVESPMSVARAVSMGVTNVVATFGAKISEDQVNLLVPFDRVYLWFDRDKAGISGEAKLLRRLYLHTDVRVVTPDRGKDLGDCEDVNQMVQKLNEAVPAALRWMK